jgi:hypothetical protein
MIVNVVILKYCCDGQNPKGVNDKKTAVRTTPFHLSYVKRCASQLVKNGLQNKEFAVSCLGFAELLAWCDGKGYGTNSFEHFTRTRHIP